MKTCTALVAALILFGLLLPEANAAHPTQMCLDIEPDTNFAYTNGDSEEVLEARVGATDAGHPPENEGCVANEGGGQLNVDFEVTGASDPDDGNSPETPDRTCTTSQDSASCQVIPPSDEGGDQTIAGWIDFDNDDATIELDQGEGYDESGAPGESAEPDSTDVALWEWRMLSCSCGRRVATTLTINYRESRNLFIGMAAARARRCEIGREVTLRKVRPGINRTVAVDKTNSRGVWKIYRPRAKGRYYAFVSRKRFDDRTGGTGTCSRDKSPTIRIPF